MGRSDLPPRRARRPLEGAVGDAAAEVLQQLQQRRHDELLRLAADEDVRHAHQQRGERLADLLAARAGQPEEQLLQQRAGVGERAAPGLPPERHRARERVQRLS